MPVRLLQVTALAAFFCASGVHAATAFESFMGTVVGNNTTVGFGSGGAPLATSASGLGTPGLGNVGLSQSGSGVSAAGRVTVPLGNTGKTVAAVARTPIARAAFLRGLGAIAGGPAGALAIAAAPLVLDWLSQSGVKVNPEGGFMRQGQDSQYACDPSTNYKSSPAIGSQSNAACGELPAGQVYLEAKAVSANATQCTVRNSCHVSVVYGEWNTQRGLASGWMPASLDDVIMYMDAPEAPQLTPDVVREAVVKSGVDPFGGAKAVVAVDGPASVPGATTKVSQSVKLVPGTNVEAPAGATQTDPGTMTTTSTKTHPITYDGANVKYGTLTNNVSNITNNVTNVTTTETTSTEEKQDDNEPDQCEKRPNSLGCKEIDFDTPEGEIPRKQIDVSWSPVDLGLGSGSCPAPVQIYENKQFSYQSTCDNLHIIKPLVIAIALFVGGMILFGGRADQ